MKYFNQHCPPNPTLEFADSITIPEGTDEIISQGGGSTIDVGKWLARKYNLKHTAIPTTCGTGSEVTKYCVLMVDGKKKTFTDEAFIPNSYVLNPSLLMTLPDEVLVSSALDALSQAFESQWSKNSTAESRNYAQMAINLILTNLHEARRFHWEEKYRMNLLIAANFSGRAINITKTNVCHAISYPLTELYKIPHGLACAMSLNYFTQKLAGVDLTWFLEPLNLPKPYINAVKIAHIAIKSEKLLDCPLDIKKADIVSSIT